MKKIFYIIPLILSLAASCQKVKFEISDDPFMMAAKNVQARSLLIDIIPETNDFYFYYGVMEVADFDKYGSDATFVREQEELNRLTYDVLIEGGFRTGTYQDVILYRSAVLEPYILNDLLTPETDYYLYAYAFDENIQAIEKVHKIKFRTAKEIHSDITFEISVMGSEITVTPSNSDQYLFDFANEDELKEYSNSAYVYYLEMIDTYEKYGFMDTMVSRGVDTNDMADYYALEPGEIVYVVAAGYDHGITSSPVEFKVTYNGPGKAGTVEEVPLN